MDVDSDRGWFCILGALIFIAFSPLDEPGGIEVMIVGAGGCALTAMFFFMRQWK